MWFLFVEYSLMLLAENSYGKSYFSNFEEQLWNNDWWMRYRLVNFQSCDLEYFKDIQTFSINWLTELTWLDIEQVQIITQFQIKYIIKRKIIVLLIQIVMSSLID